MKKMFTTLTLALCVSHSAFAGSSIVAACLALTDDPCGLKIENAALQSTQATLSLAYSENLQLSQVISSCRGILKARGVDASLMNDRESLAECAKVKAENE